MILRLLKRLRHPLGHENVAGLLSAEALENSLHRERLRCDRSGSQFAILTVELISSDSLRRDIGRLGNLLRARLRATDEIGLLRPDCVGILLPDTSAAGAWKVAEDLDARFAAAEMGVRLHVLVYPTHDDDGDVDQGRGRPSEPLAPQLARSMPVWKRLIDVTGASLGLILFAVPMLCAAALIKLTSRGPVFFVQERAGLGARPFRMIKFRTMIVDADALKSELQSRNEQDGPAFKMRNDPRITLVGRWLRKTSIDELPQLWNVLKGDMSLVGPRPLPCDESQRCLHWQRQRLDATPGLTCIWQVRGRCRVSFEDWARMDIKYIRDRSLIGDLGLIVQTVPAVLRGSGAQ